MARQLVTSPTTSRDYDVIIATSQSWKWSHSETGNWIYYPCGPFEHTLL